MKRIKFDFNNLFSTGLGRNNGVTEREIQEKKGDILKAQAHLRKILSSKQARVSLGLEWANLPFQEKKTIDSIQSLGNKICRKYEHVLFLGIGGSYLGLKAAQDALAPAYYNDFKAQRKKLPRVYFEGNNLDPSTLSAVLKNLNPKKTFVVVISKSGETTETKAAFLVVKNWLKQGTGKLFGRQILAITDPKSGSLRREVDAAQKKDKFSFPSLPLLKGVGGRFSEFNMGLLHLAIIGVQVSDVLNGARQMARECRKKEIFQNPALMYALLMNILYERKGKAIAVLMPFSQALKSTADWYIQLLAESLGKKYGRKIRIAPDGSEVWEADRKAVLNAGRTPISVCGTGDLHSIQQNNIEGENNKTITFIKVENFKQDIRVPKEEDLLGEKLYSKLLSLALEATEWALVREQRLNCTIILPEISPFYWGALLFFFEMACAFEGELLNINAFDQPGVEGYKNYMYYKLGKKGLPLEFAKTIKKFPLIKKKKYII